MALEITEQFLDHLRKRADDLHKNAAYAGRYDDGGAHHLRELICAYTAGRDGKVPSFWVDELQSFVKQQDVEYNEYLRLKAKFEGAQ